MSEAQYQIDPHGEMPTMFPPDDIDPKLKDGKWLAQVGRAIWWKYNMGSLYFNKNTHQKVTDWVIAQTGQSTTSYSSYTYAFEFGSVAIKTDSTFKNVIGIEVKGDTSKVLNEFGRRAAIGYYVAEAIKTIEENRVGYIYIDGKKYLFTLKEIK